MTTFLLIIIYISFISLGLPDAILGSSWPMMHKDLNTSISTAGIITMIICGGTIVSSLLSNKLIEKFGTAKVTVISVLLTAIGIYGVSFTPNLTILCLLAVPMGLGAGAIDSVLNNFVALHYESKHMNWLHCFWGVGATSGPLLMSLFLYKEGGWRSGYTTIGILQFILVGVLVFTSHLWEEVERKKDVCYKEQKSGMSIKNLLKLKGMKEALIGFFAYCSVEATTGLWGSSFLVICKGISVEQAAKWVSFYYLGITIGRFLSGFLSMRLDNKEMIRYGQIICLIGTIVLMIPLSEYFQMTSLILIGLGCAPIYPAMLHETPVRFGGTMSQGIMGIQMATAYVGSTFIPPLFGLIGSYIGFNILPLFLGFITFLMFVSTERVNKIVYDKEKNE